METLMQKALRRLVLAAFCTTLPLALHAQEWVPTKPVRIVVPITGSTNDFVGRLVASKLEEVLGQPIIVENKPGAGGNIGANLVAKAPPDGYTLLVGYNGPIAINKTLFDNMPYDPQKDLAPITLAVSSPQYLTVNKDMPVKTVADLVAWSKANPGKLSYASVAAGSASHLTMEMLKEASGMQAEHVPYRGASPALVDLIAGNVQAAFFVPGNVQQYVKEKRLKLIASSGEKRFASTPDVPTLIESGYPGFIATSWIGFLAPAGTPKNIIDRYNKEIVKILKMPDVQEKLHGIEFEVVGNSPEEFRKWIDTEVTRWGKVIKSTGAKAS
jgi:tripartite-type tricarboxylate transporter receptor subunit TctC